MSGKSTSSLQLHMLGAARPRVNRRRWCEESLSGEAESINLLAKLHETDETANLEEVEAYT